MSKFAERLRYILSSRHMTQADMAKLIEVAPGTLSAYLRDGEGRKVPTLDTLERIAEKLGVSVGWLCGEDTTKIIPNYLELKCHELTYEKLFKIIDGLCLLETKGGEPFFEMHVNQRRNSQGELDYCYSLTSFDPVLFEYYKDRKRIEELYYTGTIDDEMFEGWIEKRLKKYADRLIDLDITNDLPF